MTLPRYREAMFLEHLWVQTRGSGDPVTLFVHGLTSSLADVTPFAAATEGTRVFYDLRGHGRSASPDDSFGYERLLADLMLVADHYNATRALGVSVSADCLTIAMAGAPARFQKLALVMPSALDQPNRGSAHFAGMADDLERMSLEEYADRCEWDPVFGFSLADRPRLRRVVRSRILRMNTAGIPKALRTYASGPAPLPAAETLRTVTAPVLILGQDGDPVHDAGVARRLAGLLPNATLRLWPEPPAMLDDPIHLAQIIGRFFG